MNSLIKKAIRVRGLANDDFISIADAREINDYLVDNYAQKWHELRGQDAGSESTGYYLVDRRKVKTETTVLNNRASRVWGEIYNLGFSTDTKDRLENYRGQKSSSISTVGYYLSQIMKEDIESGVLYNSEYEEILGTTGTKLDVIVETIFNDQGLLKHISTSDMRIGAASANSMNHLIVEAIVEEGLCNDSKLTTADIRTINNYLVTNHKKEWARLHGDYESGEETGYHKV